VPLHFQLPPTKDLRVVMLGFVQLKSRSSNECVLRYCWQIREFALLKGGVYSKRSLHQATFPRKGLTVGTPFWGWVDGGVSVWSRRCAIWPLSPNPHTKQVTICQTTRWRSNIDTYYQPLDVTVYLCYYTVLVNHQWALLTFFILLHADFFATCVRRFWWRFRMLGEHEEKKKNIEVSHYSFQQLYLDTPQQQFPLVWTLDFGFSGTR
jgi:hypothetical protein